MKCNKCGKISNENKDFIVDSKYSNHILWDNENVLHQEGDPLHTELLESIPELIDFYEEVRHLDKFDPNHCPIIEIQTVNEKNYFLQYHRTRNFSAVDFKLDRELEKGEYEVDFVRGAIYPTVCKVVLANWQDCIPTSLKEEDTISPENWKIPEIEEGDLYTHNYDLYHEIMLPKRTLQMIDHRPDIDLNIFNSMLADHFSRSLVFKPAVTVAYSEEIGFYTKTEFTEARLRASKQKESQHIDISIESDGRKAYVKRVA